jgi:SAM-dependent methyltransferase
MLLRRLVTVRNMTTLSIVIPYLPPRAGLAHALREQLASHADIEVLLAAEGDKAHPVFAQQLKLAQGEVVVVQEADERYPLQGWEELTKPIRDGKADIVLGQRTNASWAERALGALGQPLMSPHLGDPFTGQRAFHRSVLDAFSIQEHGSARTVELMMKATAEKYRVATVPVSLTQGAPPSTAELAPAVAVVGQYLLGRDDQDNQHPGYTSLSRMESGAPRYNAWLGQKFREHAGSRVLEVGAGLGTITEQLVEGRERIVALEADPFYVRRLNNRFRGLSQVSIVASKLEGADLGKLKAEKCDTVVLSNVLEHIEDDAEAVRKFAALLPPNGRLLILVPALPVLFGAMDEAVGHYRRYTEPTLRRVITENGFSLEKMEWMNLLGIPGWFLNGRIFKRTAVPALQLRIYDRIAPLWAKLEARVPLPVGQSLFALAKRNQL